MVIRSPDPDGIFNPGTHPIGAGLDGGVREAARDQPGQRDEPGDRAELSPAAGHAGAPDAAGTAAQDQSRTGPVARGSAARSSFTPGTFVSADGRSTAILIGDTGGADRTGLYQTIREVIAARGAVAEEIAVTGAPVAEALLGIHILEDLGVPRALLGTSTRAPTESAAWKMPASLYELRLLIARQIGLVPVAVLVMMLVFLLTFRNVLAMLLPLPGVVATLMFVFGLMGWCGVPIYLTIAVMPVLLTATGVTNDIYLFSRYFTLLREKPGPGPGRTGARNLRRDGRARWSSTSLTSAIGFLSFGFSPLGRCGRLAFSLASACCSV